MLPTEAENNAKLTYFGSSLLPVGWKEVLFWTDKSSI